MIASLARAQSTQAFSPVRVMVAPVGLFGKHRYTTSMRSLGGCGTNPLAGVPSMYSNPSYRPPSSATPVLPAITLVSTYTGYTGSGTAMRLPEPRISRKLLASGLLPSDRKISSSATCTPRSRNSHCAIALRTNSWPVAGPYPWKRSRVARSSTPSCSAFTATAGSGSVTSPMPQRTMFFARSGRSAANTLTRRAISGNR